MRTDVKVGLICAFAIVLCVVIYFVAVGNAKHPAPAPDSSPGQATMLTRGDGAVPDPVMPAVASAPGGAVGGGLIGFPSTVTPEPPGMTSPTTPGMGSIPTPGPTYGAPVSVTSTLGTPVSAGASSALPTSLPAAPAHATMEVILPRPSGTPSLALPASPTTYKIQQGDMLGTIGRRFNVTVKALQAANPGIEPTRLKVNTVIKIPGSTTAAASHTTLASHTAATPAAAPRAAATPRSSTIKPGSTYKVKKGDTLITIARAAYGNTNGGWQKIFRANRTELTDPDLVPVGTEILIPR
jgi:LysM repeat protein